MKTKNNICKINYNKNINVSYRKTLNKIVINNKNKSLVKSNYKIKQVVPYKSSCSIINKKTKKKHIINGDKHNTIMKVVNKSRQRTGVNDDLLFGKRLHNSFIQLKGHSICNIKQLHFITTKHPEQNTSYLSEIENYKLRQNEIVYNINK